MNMDYEEFLSKKLNVSHLGMVKRDPRVEFAEKMAMEMADPALPMEVDMLYRDDWLAFPPIRRQPMVTPVRFIRLIQTGGKSCTDRDHCIARVRKLQEKHVISKGLDDIAYNFLIDHEGRVYEGRGWHVKGEKPPRLIYLYNNCVDICILGNWKREPIPEPTIKCLGHLINYGVKENLIKEKYLLIGLKDIDEVQKKLRQKKKKKK